MANNNDHNYTATIIMGVAFGIVSAILLIVFVKYSLRKRRENKHQIMEESPVVVTSATHTAPGGYPVTQQVGGYTVTQMPTPVPGYPPAHNYNYPVQQTTIGHMQMPMPMPMPNSQPPPVGMQQYAAPYPPAGSNAANMNPPSYDAVVSGTGAGQPNNTNTYAKQSPYNPSFTAQ